MPAQPLDIPENAVEVRFVHASGPGGQHVNKNATAVELRVDIDALAAPHGPLTYAASQRLRQQQKNRINRDGVLIIQADEFRSQINNRKAAMARLHELLAQCLIPPKRRVATRPSYNAKQKRVNHKKQRGQVKANRKKPSLD